MLNQCGHSKGSMEKFYSPKDRLRDADKASQAFDICTGWREKAFLFPPSPTMSSSPPPTMSYSPAQMLSSSPPPTMSSSPDPMMSSSISPRPTLPSSSLTIRGPVTTHSNRIAILSLPWGTSHPDQRPASINARVAWSYAEKEYIANWIQLHPVGTVRQLYNKIHGSRTAHACFHRRHTISIDRLNNQFKVIKNPKKRKDSNEDDYLSMSEHE